MVDNKQFQVNILEQILAMNGIVICPKQENPLLLHKALDKMVNTLKIYEPDMVVVIDEKQNKEILLNIKELTEEFISS